MNARLNVNIDMFRHGPLYSAGIVKFPIGMIKKNGALFQIVCLWQVQNRVGFRFATPLKRRIERGTAISSMLISRTDSKPCCINVCSPYDTVREFV